MVGKALKYKLYILLIILSSSVYGQIDYGSEEELKEAAAKLFSEKKFNEAKPLFAQLLSNYPKDPNYNYKYAACLLITEKDKEEPIKFLNIAIRKSTVEPLAYFYLGKAYHLNYQFNEAITNYSKFQSKATSDEIKEYKSARQIEMCKNGISLLDQIKDISVLSKQEIKESEFFRVYDLKGIGGKVVVKPDEFKSKYDLKVGERSLIYIPKNPEIIYYSSYGDKGNNGKDIYYVRKLPNGEWGKPQDLGNPINSEFDEEYPFLHPDGKTLYFSSNGHNSMGGYDVFKSTYNETSGTWSKPINLDFAFSSPDDDIMFISDEDNIYAYFASKRSSGYDQISVYKVKVASRPASYSIIKGDFIAENSEKKNATIKVLDANTNEFLSEYRTKENGEYIIALPSNGGKYKFVIETDDESPVHSGMIEVPVLSEFRPLKQELRLVGAGDDEKLVIKNLFDEQIASNIDKSELMKDLIKQKAQLEVTGDENALANNNKEKTEPKISDYEYTKLTNADLVNNAKQQASELQQNSNKSQKERDYSLTLAKEKSAEASKLFAESEKLLASISSNMSEEEKLSIEQKALDKKKEAGQLAAEAVIANNVARSLEAEYIEKQTLANKANVLSEKVNVSINASNRDSAVVAYKDLQTLIANNREMQDASSIEKQLAYERAENDKKKTQESYEYLAQLQESKSSVINRKKGLEQAKEAEKSKKKQEQIQNEINALNIDLEDIEYNIAEAQEKSDELKKKSRTSESVNKYTNALFQDIALNSSNSNIKLSDAEKESLLRQLDYYESNNLVGEFDETLASEFKLNNADYSMNSYEAKHQKELDQTKLITDPIELASAKKEINQQWLNDIKAEKENKLDELIDATSLQEKADIQKRISELNELQKEKEYEIAESNKIIEENQLANNSNNNSSENSNNTSNQNSNNTTENNNNSVNSNNQNTNETNNNSVEISESTKETTEFITATNKKYTDKLSRLGNSELDNEQKELIYEAWQEELQEKVLLKKLELIETTDTKNEEALNTQISLLSAEYENVNNESEQFALNSNNNITESNSNSANNSSSNNSTSQENQNEEIASFNAINNNEISNYNSEYSELSTELESVTDEYERNLKLAKLNENWANSIQEEIAYREGNLENIKKSKDKKLEEEKIAQLKEIKSQKENDSYTYAENAEELLAEKNTTLASNNSANTNNNSQENTQNFIENPTYSNPSAEENANKANQLENEAEKANSEYQELINQSYNATSEEEREELTTKAEALRIQSENKFVESSEVSAVANQAEYNRNSTVIKSMQKNIGVSNTQTTIAELKNEEAAVYFNDAKSLRKEAENTSSFSSKQNLLNQAKEKELIAIQRQNEAKEIYSKEGGPQIAAIDNMSNQELLAANNFTVGNQTNNNTTSQTNNTTLASNQNNNTENSSSENNSNTTTNNTENTNNNIVENNSQTNNSNQNNTNLATNNNTNNTSSSNQTENNSSTTNNNSENNNNESTNNNISENNSSTNQNNTTTNNSTNTNSSQNSNNTENSSTTQINPNNYESIESVLAKVDNSQSINYNSAGDVKKYEADILQQEAEDLNDQATALRKQAEETRKKKEKEALILEAESLEQKAARKAKEAEVLYEEAEELPAITSKNNPEIIASTKSNEELNEQEKSTLANLTDNEVSKILETEEYKAYQSSVERKRKLMKEAEVEYAYSEQYSTEAKNQQAIKEELQILAESDNISEEQKEEINEQIKTIDKRIALLNEQSNQYKLSAGNKTEKAKQSDTFINTILARLDENTKSNLVAIEKENYNTNGNIAASTLVGSNTTLANNQENNATENETNNSSNTQTNNQNNTNTSSNNTVANNNSNSNNTNNTTNNNSSTNNSNNNSGNNTNMSLGIGTVNLNNIAEITMPKQINKDIIVYGNNNQSAYNEQKKIPNNTPYPDGLIYAVQVGAFRNPIPQDLYKGFAPVFGTKLDNGITRYTAGLFTSYSSADDSKNKIRALGYSDAFVVIFYNGERISQTRANEILNGGKQIASNNQNTSSNNNSQNTNTTNNTTNIDNLPTINPNTSDGSVNVSQIKGIFFTVQVGVYSKPVTPNDLNNIRPLNSETTPNGLIRYTSGRYKTLAEANAAKDRIRNLGISDAFVTAYKDGNKISVNEALAELQNSNNSTENNNQNSSENNTENNNTIIENNNSTENNSSNQNNTNNETNNNENEELGELEFKVLIGEYTDEVPVDVAAIYLKIAKRGLKSTQEGDTTIYTIGSFKEYKDALKTKIEMKSLGLKDADVIVYEDGVRKPIEPILKKLGQ